MPIAMAGSPAATFWVNHCLWLGWERWDNLFTQATVWSTEVIIAKTGMKLTLQTAQALRSSCWQDLAVRSSYWSYAALVPERSSCPCLLKKVVVTRLSVKGTPL